MLFASRSQSHSDTAAAVRTAQLQAHVASTGLADGASLFVALLLMPLLVQAAPAIRVAVWAAALVAVLLLRLGVQRAARQPAAAGAQTARWLTRYRGCMLLHGLVWGAVALLPDTLRDHDMQAVLIFVAGGLAAGSMMLTVFDLRAALLFVVPALLPLFTRLLLTETPLPAFGALAIGMLLTLLVIGTVAGRRSERAAHALAAARQAEAGGVAGARQAETLLHLIFDHADEGIAVFDHGPRLAAWNTRFARMAGVDPAGLRAGLPLAAPGDAEADADAGPEPQTAQRITALIGRDDGTAQREQPDGRTIETRRSPVPGGGFIAVCTDVTERNASASALQDQQRMLSLLLERTEQGFWFVDNAQRTTDANPAMCRMLGIEREQMLGRTIYDFVDADNAAVFRHQVAQREAGLTGGYEVALLRADGTLLHCFNNATPMFDAAGRKTGSVGLFSDISAQKNAEVQIRRSGELLAQKSRVLEVTLDSLEQGVLSIDAEGRSNAWNRRFLELLQIPESLMQTRPTLQMLVAYQMGGGHFGRNLENFSDADAGREGMARYLAGDEKALVLQYQRTRSDGTLIDVQAHVADDGSWVRTYTDITARADAERALRESENRFRTMADGAPALIWLSGDEGGAPLWFNQRWLEYTGRGMEEELRLPWSERMHPEDNAACRAAYKRAVSQRRAYDIEFRLKRADGTFSWIADTGIPRFAPDGRLEGYISYGWDISERKAAQSALIAAKDEAERANRAKSDFLSRMSHELRTPMNAILGFGQLMQSDAADPLSANQRIRLHELLHGGRHLLGLINEVLDLARIEAGTPQLQLQPVDLAPLVADALRLAEPEAAQRGVRLLQAGAMGLVVADPTRLPQVLLNLLSNAILYSRDGGSVEVRCTDEGPLLRISVSNAGPGISAAQQRRLFQAFERLDATPPADAGAGVGLALSKWLVDLMHGDIGVDSRPGSGSTFWVRLASASSLPVTAAEPRQALAAAPAAAKPPAGATAPRRTVLYVEDNPVNQMLMEGMLAHRKNVRLLLADLPGQGLEMAASTLPDLVLLDIQLPDMDGFEVLRRLRLQPATRDIPVIAVSANAMQADIEGAMRAGFLDYVTKPLDMQRLLAVVDKALAAAPLPH